MSERLRKLSVKNYRSLADVSVELGAVNVFFGPNGAGKSSLLNVFEFMGDCVARNVSYACERRNQGVGLLYDGAPAVEPISIALGAGKVTYEMSLQVTSGRINPRPGERLESPAVQKFLFQRRVGSDVAESWILTADQGIPPERIELAPDELALVRYVRFPSADEATYHGDVVDMKVMLSSIRAYDCHDFDLPWITERGSKAGIEVLLAHDARNIWSVLRNLRDRDEVDYPYDTIMRFMAESFPAFDGLRLESTGPASVYGSFLEKYRRGQVPASDVARGYLQMLLILTALFSEPNGYSLILLDEPETSLHPWALSVLAKAVKHAAEEWDRQVCIATHSPVLISQFEPNEIFAVTQDEGRTQIQCVAKMAEIQDLLEDYAAGSLYMAEAIAPQSNRQSVVRDE